MSVAPAPEHTTTRQIAYRTKGLSHGPITRLMSPGDLGELLKPFVFLDLFDNGGDRFPAFGLHPHSGLATLTYIAEGSVSYEDTNGAKGILRQGGVEWMRAGKGVWHAGGAGDPGRTRGFQLWVALPPYLELGQSESLYQGEEDIPKVGPAEVLLGDYQGMTSRISAPSPINYLAVSLRAGETWTYDPPAGHSVLWIAVGKGSLVGPGRVDYGEIVAFQPSEQSATFTAETDAEFVLGSAEPHPHDLVLGYYSVHTSPEALEVGEAHIQAVRQSLVNSGRL